VLLLNLGTVMGRRGISAAAHESRGSDIAAACGQLRAEATAGPKPLHQLYLRWIRDERRKRPPTEGGLSFCLYLLHFIHDLANAVNPFL
jgi:hypothetical protein